jgi:hypothetical protein
MKPNLADKVVGGAVIAATNDFTYQFTNDASDVTEEILLMRQSGAAFSGTIYYSDNGSDYTAIETFTSVLALTIRGGFAHDYVKVAVTGQPALMYVKLQNRIVTSSAKRHWDI